MKSRTKTIKYLIFLLSIFAFIFDSKLAFEGAKQGVDLCLSVIIPSLFPLMIIMAMLSSSLLGKCLPLPNKIRYLLNLPKGAEMYLFSGLLSGYPIGAKSIAQANKEGALSNSQAARMLSFCNNAGPAFIFGMGASLFSNPYVPVAVWIIQILSATICCILIPGGDSTEVSTTGSSQLSLPNTLAESVKSMGLICGWVVLFRTWLLFLERWILWLVPTSAAVLLMGTMELSNGICQLNTVSGEAIRFLLMCCMTSFGGFCVYMQTLSLCDNIDSRLYLPGKIMQAGVSIILSTILQLFLFETPLSWKFVVCLWLALTILLIILQKSVAFYIRFLYNNEKHTRGNHYAVSEKDHPSMRVLRIRNLAGRSQYAMQQEGRC